MKKIFGIFAILLGILAFTSCSGGGKVEEDVSSQNDDLARTWLVGNANIGDVYTQEICLKEGDEKNDSRWSVQVPADVNSMVRTHLYTGLDGETEYKVNYTSLRNSSTILTANRSVITKAISQNAEAINAQFSGVFAGCKVQTTWESNALNKQENESVYVAYLPLLVRYYNKKEATTPFLLTFVLVPIKVENTTLPSDNNTYSSAFAEETKNLIINWTADKSGDIKLK